MIYTTRGRPDGAWSYCKCGQGFDLRTIEEDIDIYDNHRCPNCNREVDRHKSDGEWLIDLQEQITLLEQRVIDLERGEDYEW